MEKEPKPLIIECSDGRLRAVSFQTGTKLVSRSVVISEGHNAGRAIEGQGLNDRQRKGLGVPPRTKAHQLRPVDAPAEFLSNDPPFGDPL